MRGTIVAMMAAVLLACLVACAGVAVADEPACSPRRFEGTAFTVCAFTSSAAAFSLVRTDAGGAPLRQFSTLARAMGTRARSVRFAMNAGMFDIDGAPIGLYVEDGVVRHGLNRRTGKGNFYLMPNGVFLIDAAGMPAVETSEVYAERKVVPRWATQSGPMLVINGAFNAQISPDGASKYIRNAVGVRKDHVAVFVISDEVVSFGRLARFLRDDLDCDNALYLDGAVSSLWVPSQGRRDNRAPLGPLLIVTAKAR